MNHGTPLYRANLHMGTLGKIQGTPMYGAILHMCTLGKIQAKTDSGTDGVNDNPQ